MKSECFTAMTTSWVRRMITICNDLRKNWTKIGSSCREEDDLKDITLLDRLVWYDQIMNRWIFLTYETDLRDVDVITKTIDLRRAEVIETLSSSDIKKRMDDFKKSNDLDEYHVRSKLSVCRRINCPDTRQSERWSCGCLRQVAKHEKWQRNDRDSWRNLQLTQSRWTSIYIMQDDWEHEDP